MLHVHVWILWQRLTFVQVLRFKWPFHLFCAMFVIFPWFHQHISLEDLLCFHSFGLSMLFGSSRRHLSDHHLQDNQNLNHVSIRVCFQALTCSGKSGNSKWSHSKSWFSYQYPCTDWGELLFYTCTFVDAMYTSSTLFGKIFPHSPVH